MTMYAKIYTDGSCVGNPGPGGWAALIRRCDSSDLTIQGGDANTTNNRMELTAIIEALRRVALDVGSNTHVKIYSDSMYCVNGISKWVYNWIKCNFKGKKNVDLWMSYLDVSNGLDVEICWVKAHNNHTENELVDSLALQEARRFA